MNIDAGDPLPTPDTGPDPGASATPDPPPFEVVNEQGALRAVLLCDHGGRAIPSAYGRLGLDESLLFRHIAWDIGAGDVTRRLADMIDAPAIVANYSRLFIDPNRHLDHPDSIIRISDSVPVPGNERVDAAEAERRTALSFRPYHANAATLIAGHEARKGVVATIGIHSFTPVMDGIERPWHIGILWNQDTRLAQPLIAELRKTPGVVVGDNKPYSGINPPAYSFWVHGAEPGRPHVTIEIRQDLIDTHHGAAEWAGIVGPALRTVVAGSGVFEDAEVQP